MTKDEVLKLALEALHGFIPYLPLNDEAQCGRYDKSITAIKEALSQEEKHMTPQAYLYTCDGDIDHPVLTHKKMDWPEKYPHWQEIPLFMAQRTWVELTMDDFTDILKLASEGRPLEIWELFKAVENKLKEKNT